MGLFERAIPFCLWKALFPGNVSGTGRCCYLNDDTQCPMKEIFLSIFIADTIPQHSELKINRG